MGGGGDAVGEDAEVDALALEQHVHQVDAADDELRPRLYNIYIYIYIYIYRCIIYI